MIFALLIILLLAPLENLPATEPTRYTNGSNNVQPAADDWPNVFVYRDTFNAYLFREGDSAIFFNLGDGRVIDHLQEIGVRNIKWVIFSDHHR